MPDDKNRDILEGEVVGETPHDYNTSYTTYTTYTTHSGSRGFGPRMSVFHISGSNAQAYRGIQVASFVTLALFFGCLLQWGFLAALGFAFFYAIAAALGFWYNVRRILSGRLPNPWGWRICSWIVCMLLVSWLV